MAELDRTTSASTKNYKKSSQVSSSSSNSRGRGSRISNNSTNQRKPVKIAPAPAGSNPNNK